MHRNIRVGLLDNNAAGDVVNSRVTLEQVFSQVLPVVTTSGTQDTRKEKFLKDNFLHSDFFHFIIFCRL